MLHAIKHIITKISFTKIILGITTLFLFSCKAYYQSFYTDPEKCLDAARLKKPYDVVIIPGFTHDSGSVNPILSERVKWAYYLYKNGYAKNIIFSGSAVRSPYVEAKVMRLFALQLGIKDEHMFTETTAEHTTENLYYSTVMAQNLGFKLIAFATEPAQASFMKPFKRKFKLDVDFIPVVTDSLKLITLQLNPIDERPAFVTGFISIDKRDGFFKRLRGTRGHKVKADIRKAKKLKQQ